MGLTEYRKKRRFDRTAEPEGDLEFSRSGRLYVIQTRGAAWPTARSVRTG
jgi:hypothetical protein